MQQAPPPAQLIKILSPVGGATVDATAPVKISVQFLPGANPSGMRVLLDGVDITAQFSTADSSGIRTANVAHSAANLGKNQIQVTSGTQMASSMFWVSYEQEAGGSGPGSGHGGGAVGLPLLIPITTRVLLSGDGSVASDWGISLYEDPDDPTKATNIQAPSGPSDGFQIVMLRRSDLSLVLNTTIENPIPAETGNFYLSNLAATLQSYPGGCGAVGCLVIIQSLHTIGYTPCYDGGNTIDNPDCTQMAEIFDQLGGTARIAFANGSNPRIAYSFIGNLSLGTVPSGTWYERLTCNGSNYDSGQPACDSLGYPNTSLTAAKNGPVGRISGALIRDNHGNFTYAQNAPVISFNTLSDDTKLTNTITVQGVKYVSPPLPPGKKGGFHLLILNRTTLAPEENLTYAPHDTVNMTKKIGTYGSYGNLFFICSFGDIRFDRYPFGSESYRDAKWNTSVFLPKIGGTQQVFYLLDLPETISPTHTGDSYTLVGAYMDHPHSTAGPPYTIYSGPGAAAERGAEMSTVISRETYAYPRKNSDMDGFLELNHEGYYSPKFFGPRVGMSTADDADVISASLLDPVGWPFPGPDPAKSRAAYDWISLQLCCTDIRAAYRNLNASPTLWLNELENISYDPAKVPGTDEQDFNAMKQQLFTEFKYVMLVRGFEQNLVGLYQDQQTNVGLMLQQASDQVTANLQVDLNTKAHRAGWTGIVGDVFNVVGGASGFLSLAGPEGTGAGAGIHTACAVGTLVLHITAEHTNSPAGSSLKAQEAEETTAGQMATEVANEFAANLVSLGNEFDRIVSDWGRLKTLGAPLLANKIPWDEDAAGYLLRAYDRVVRRQFYTNLIKANTSVVYYPYFSDGSTPYYAVWDNGNHKCNMPAALGPHYWEAPSRPLLFYPSGKPDPDDWQAEHDWGWLISHYWDPNGDGYPWDYAWAVWALKYNQHTSDVCPLSHTQPSTFGLFKPIDPANPENLGVYRLWWFQRKEGVSNTVTRTRAYPCYLRSQFSDYVPCEDQSP